MGATVRAGSNELNIVQLQTYKRPTISAALGCTADLADDVSFIPSLRVSALAILLALFLKKSNGKN